MVPLFSSRGYNGSSRLPLPIPRGWRQLSMISSPVGQSLWLPSVSQQNARRTYAGIYDDADAEGVHTECVGSCGRRQVQEEGVQVRSTWGRSRACWCCGKVVG
jgi:hypothetical protein